MRAHPDHSGEPGSQRTVWWLRFVKEDGGGVRAALFETTARGEPLGFFFTRAELLAQDGRAYRERVTAVAGQLLRASKRSPALTLGLANEIPAHTFEDGFEAGAPFLLVESERVDAGEMSGGILELDNLLEPFERAGRCLSEAFGDPRVRGLNSISGLSVTVSVCPPSAVRQGAELSGLSERLWAILAPPRVYSAEPVQDPRLEWPGELMPFQRDGVRALLDMKRLLLADDMGLGKTIQAIAAMRILRARGEIESCLVVAPASVLDQWRREIAKWSPRTFGDDNTRGRQRPRVAVEGQERRYHRRLRDPAFRLSGRGAVAGRQQDLGPGGR